MANPVKYSGLCETCDNDQACRLKRIPQLEVIECEQFCTHPIVNDFPAAAVDAANEDSVEIGQEGK